LLFVVNVVVGVVNVVVVGVVIVVVDVVPDGHQLPRAAGSSVCKLRKEGVLLMEKVKQEHVYPHCLFFLSLFCSLVACALILGNQVVECFASSIDPDAEEEEEMLLKQYQASIGINNLLCDYSFLCVKKSFNLVQSVASPYPAFERACVECYFCFLLLLLLLLLCVVTIYNLGCLKCGVVPCLLLLCLIVDVNLLM